MFFVFCFLFLFFVFCFAVTVIREETVRLQLRRAAISLIQRSWRIYTQAKMNARKEARDKEIDFDESYGPHWDTLGSKDFQRQLKASRKKIAISLFKWKEKKRELHSNIPMLDGVSLDVSHVVDELIQMDSEYKVMNEKVRVLEEKLTVQVPMLIQRMLRLKEMKNVATGGGEGSFNNF